MIRFPPRFLDGFIYSELGDGGFDEHAVPARGFLPGR